MPPEHLSIRDLDPDQLAEYLEHRQPPVAMGAFEALAALVGQGGLVSRQLGATAVGRHIGLDAEGERTQSAWGVAYLVLLVATCCGGGLPIALIIGGAAVLGVGGSSAARRYNHELAQRLRRGEYVPEALPEQVPGTEASRSGCLYGLLGGFLALSWRVGPVTAVATVGG